MQKNSEKRTYEESRIAVDPVIFTIHEDKLKVFLHIREKEPFKNRLELPGGILFNEETAEQTLARKIDDMFNIKKVFFQQFFTFTSPDRDPRERTVSIGFIALINSQKIKDFSGWHDYSSLKNLAFDHKEIIDKARDYLKKEINSLIIKHFMPELFPLNDLQKIYEIIESKNYDNRNFRKKMINNKIVVETSKIENQVSHRPAKLYKFKI
jgi:8-oxo-dGTP diphosphatase